jgi:hypothetical protein
MSKYYRHLIEAGLLLDIYPNAAVAYSLRKLRSGYKKVFNLLTYSEDISQTTYQKVNLVTTGTPPYIDVVTAPNGTLTADKLIENTSFSSHFITQTLGITVVGLDYNFSVYLKAGERTKTDIQAGGVGQARINLLTGAIETSTFPISPIVTDVGNGWWRISVTFVASSTVINPLYRIFTVNNLNQSSYVGDGVSGVYVWGFQLTQSTTVLPYEKTVVAPSNGNPIRVRRSVDNTERDFGFDEINDTLTDWVGYNLWSYSEEMQQSVWTKTRTTVTDNAVVAPDGNTTGDILFETTASGTHSISRAQSVTIGEDYSISFYIKDEGRRYFQIRAAVNLSTDNANLPTAMLDLTTGTVISDNGLFRVAPIITAVGGGWYKIEYGLIANSTTTSTALQLNLSTDGVNTSYVGDITKGVAVWGLQISETSTIKPYQKTEINAGGGGFVTTWYDQSINGNNATQSTPANQAQIVLNGFLIRDALSKPTTTWTTDRYTLTNGINPNTKYLSIGVLNRTANSNVIIHIGVAGSISGINGQQTFIWSATTGNIRSDMSSVVNHGNETSTGAFITTSEKNASDLKTIYLNGIALPITATQAPSLTGTNMNAFGQTGTNFTTCQYQEYIYWDSDQSADRVAIETLINDYYAIF